MCIHTCTGMCVDTCTGMCTGMCIDMCIHICVDMRTYMCMDMCIYMCIDMCRWTFGSRTAAHDGPGSKLTLLQNAEIAPLALVPHTCVWMCRCV